MTDNWSEAHRHLDRGLKLFFAADLAGAIFGVIRGDWRLATICLVAGCLAAFVGTSANRRIPAAGPTEDDEFANEKEFAEARTFACEFLEFSNLLAATMLTLGLALGLPWWSALLVAALAWIVSLFAIPVLCAPRNKGAFEVGTSPGDRA